MTDATIKASKEFTAFTAAATSGLELAGPCDAEIAEFAAKSAALIAWQQDGLAKLQAFNAAGAKLWECLQKHAGAQQWQSNTELERAARMVRIAGVDIENNIKRLATMQDDVAYDVACIQSGLEHIKRLVPQGRVKNAQ